MTVPSEVEHTVYHTESASAAGKKTEEDQVRLDAPKRASSSMQSGEFEDACQASKDVGHALAGYKRAKRTVIGAGVKASKLSDQLKQNAKRARSDCVLLKLIGEL